MRTHTSDPTPALVPNTAALPTFDAELTVNELLRQHPIVIRVLNAFGVDACCGGALTLAESAERDGLDLSAILLALELAVHDEAH